MSSFVLFKQHGPPDLIVEISAPISSDPVLFSGLFKANMSFTDDVTTPPAAMKKASSYHQL